MRDTEMVYHKSRVELYVKTNNTYPISPTRTLSSVQSVSVAFHPGKTADTCTVRLNNYNGQQTSDIKNDDRLLIYGNIGGDEVLLFDGQVNSIRHEFTTAGDSVVIDCLNRLEKLFNTLLPVTSGTNRYAHEWIRDFLLPHVNEQNPGRTISWDDNNDTITGNYQKEYKVGYQPAYQMLDDMSTPQYTDGFYYDYHLSNENKLVWKRRTQVPSGTLVCGNGVCSWKTDDGIFDIVNSIILNCGKDPANYSVLVMAKNNDSIVKNGLKMKVVPAMQISSVLTNFERQQNPSKWGDKKYPNSYPYVTTWGVTTTSDTDYRSKFREEVKRQGNEMGQNLLSGNASATYKSTIATTPTLQRQLSVIYSLTNPFLPSSFNDEQHMRVQGITYSFDRNGWIESLQIDQDPIDQVGR
jgi:hypothetical protein